MWRRMADSQQAECCVANIAVYTVSLVVDRSVNETAELGLLLVRPNPSFGVKLELSLPSNSLFRFLFKWSWSIPVSLISFLFHPKIMCYWLFARTLLAIVRVVFICFQTEKRIHVQTRTQWYLHCARIILVVHCK